LFFFPNVFVFFASSSSSPSSEEEVEASAALFVRSKSRGYKAHSAKSPPADAFNASATGDAADVDADDDMCVCIEHTRCSSEERYFPKHQKLSFLFSPPREKERKGCVLFFKRF